MVLFDLVMSHEILFKGSEPKPEGNDPQDGWSEGLKRFINALKDIAPNQK